MLRRAPLLRRIVVEDVQLPPSFAEEHKPPKGAVARRMVFLSNQGLVQSEALMAPSSSRHATVCCSLACMRMGMVCRVLN